MGIELLVYRPKIIMIVTTYDCKQRGLLKQKDENGRDLIYLKIEERYSARKPRRPRKARFTCTNEGFLKTKQILLPCWSDGIPVRTPSKSKLQTSRYA
jgi:hypothetical protein